MVNLRGAVHLLTVMLLTLGTTTRAPASPWQTDGAAATRDPAPTPAATEPEHTTQLDFFESRIRPVLIEHCYPCHSRQAATDGELQASLYVDSRQGLQQGGDSGPSVIPGDPDASLLLQAMRYETYEMPPQGRLDDQVLEDFRRWIADGAHDPREQETVPAQGTNIGVKGQDHWAYQPISNANTIVGSLGSSAATPIDALIEQHWPADLQPAPRADRITLIRRLHFDLTGLPPTPAQIEAFLIDERPDAYTRLVDRLLTSPAFGDHWGRHWLDLARFAESVTLRGLVQQEAWRYRDYVVDSWNHDRPLDQFIAEQIAGDLMPADSIRQQQQQCIATGFLALGNHNLEDQDKTKLDMDAVDEQLRVIGAAILGQTIGCARCHDHKFDPIPTRDYYALAGVLSNVQSFEHSNVSRWVTNPLPVDDATTTAIDRYQQQRAKLESEVQRLEAQLGNDSNSSKSVAADQLDGIVLDDAQAQLIGNWTTSTFSARYVGQHYLHDEAMGQGTKSATFSVTLPHPGKYAVRISYSPGSNRATNVSIRLEGATQPFQTTINQRKKPPIDGLFVELGEFEFAAPGEAELVIENIDADGHVIVDAVQWLPRDPTRIATNQTTDPAANQAQTAALQKQLAQAKQALKTAEQNAPSRPMYMGVVERDAARDTEVRIRGNVHRHGPIVPRGVLEIARGEYSATMPNDQSGRLQLAQWLTHPTNPLPARVAANRLWGWLCGEWIVRSPDNFGTTGTPPTHPQLLDYLASRLIEQQWSAKAVIREIVLSHTYQRDSIASPSLRQRDPENQLWLRAEQKRLPAESLMDAMLATCDQLDPRVGGKTVPSGMSADYGYRHDSNRRVIYWPTFRNAPPPIAMIFDGANPSLVTGRRDSSTVPPQALFMMNHPRIWDLSGAAARQLLEAPLESTDERITQIYLRILNRYPTAGESTAINAYLDQHAGSKDAGSKDAGAEDAWTDVAHALFCTLDFQYLR